MESHTQHLPASAVPRVELHVELVMGDLQATPRKGTIRGRTVGAESTPGRRSPRVRRVPWILHWKAYPVATGSASGWHPRLQNRGVVPGAEPKKNESRGSARWRHFPQAVMWAR